MSYSNTITKNDLAAILDEVIPVQGTDMSAAGIEAFVDALDIRSGESLTSKIFIATINETSYQDVVNALEAKKVVYAYTTNSQGTYNVYPYAHHNANLIVFTRTHYNQSSQQVKFVTLDSTDAWTTTTVNTADYIVEQGTNYRKWNSGLAECWGTATIGSNSAAQATYPISLVNINSCVASCGYLSNGTYVAPTIAVQPLATAVNFYARVSTSTVTSPHTVYWEIKGTWK